VLGTWDFNTMFSRSIARSIKHFRINIIIKVLILSDFIISSALNLIAPVFAIFIIDKIPGASLATVGIAAALFLLFKSIFEIPVGIIIDKTKSEADDFFTTFVGSIVAAIVYFLYIYVDSIAQLYALQILLGMAAALSYPGWYGIFSRHIDKKKEAFEWSLYDVLIGLGMAATAVLGALIVEKYDFNILFIICGTSSLVGAFVLVLIKDKLKK
jgi:MFS family permease